jgi:hypothetical protein
VVALGFVEAFVPAIVTDPQLRTQYEHLKIRGTKTARVAIARKLLTIASASSGNSGLRTGRPLSAKADHAPASSYWHLARG